MSDIQGTNNAELLTGTSTDENFITLDGADTVRAGAGNDNVNGHMVDASTGNISYYPFSGVKTLWGEDGHDFLYGGSDADLISGDAGNDTLYGAASNDALSGGLGNDSLNGGDGNDSIDGGDGADEIDTGAGLDSVLGGTGNDNINGHVVDVQSGSFSYLSYSGSKQIAGGAGDDFIYGSTDADALRGDDGHDTIHGSSGNDIMQGDAGLDVLFGEEGNDSLSGGSDDDSLNGDAGNDTLDGGDGNDTLDTGTGLDSVLGGAGNDNINGHVVDALQRSYSFNAYLGAKVIAGGGGNDFIYGGTEADQLRGDEGDDTIHADAGNDTLLGDAGSDELYGSEGNDSLDGGSGNDSLSGELGNDTLSALSGQDTLDGGEGDDTYRLGTTRFTLRDSGGTDTAVVSADFIKVPSFIEQVQYSTGTQALPYWISALLPDEAAGLGYLSDLDSSRTYYYSFPSVAPGYLTSETGDYLTGWSAFTAAEKTATQSSFSYIASLLNLHFQLSTMDDALNTLSFANNTQDQSAGYALHPSDSPLGSDVFLDNSALNQEAQSGTYAALTLIHEIGHALGLKHPFSATDSAGDSATPPYLSGAEDNTAWTVMSYNSNEAQYDFKYSDLDIAALQYLYGPSPNSRTSNDTYTVSKTSANFVWDGAGTDTLDASALTDPAVLYLTPGYWGYVGSKADTITSAGQVTVNFGSSIENLKGGTQADQLFGNAQSNRIEGGSGNDTLQGWDGSDTLVGGAGNDKLMGSTGTDWAQYVGPRSNYTISWSATNGSLTINSVAEGFDTLWDIEKLQFSDSVLDVDALRDNVAPTLLDSSPLSGALRVSYDAPVVLKFSEPVQAGTGTVILKSGNETVATYDITDAAHVSFSGSTVTLSSSSPLVPGTTYTGAISPGAIKDLAGNSWTQSTTPYTWTVVNTSVASADTVAPTVDISSWRKIVAPTASIQVPFTENIVRGNGTIALYEYIPATTTTGSSTLSAIVPASVSVSGHVLTITPTAALSASKYYIVGFDAGAIKDSAGNDFNQQDYSETVSQRLYLGITVDNTAPVAPKFAPAATVSVVSGPRVTFETSLGSFVLELNPGSAPTTTANMLSYVNAGLYDNTIFHRVIPGFMAQGGGFKSGLTPVTPTYAAIPIESNNGLQNLRGTVAMARTTDPNSATNQFFINYVDNAFLNYSSTSNPGYAVFGKVISGMSVVDSMASVQTQTVGSYQNVPITDITTLSARLTGTGQWVSTTGLLAVNDIENKASWQYSLDAGSHWYTGSGNFLRVPEGYYAANNLQLRQTDAQGLTSSTYSLPVDLQVMDISAYTLTGTTVFWKDAKTLAKPLQGVKLLSALNDKTDDKGAFALSGVDNLLLNAVGTSVALNPALSTPTNAKSAVTLTDVLAALKIYLKKPLPDTYASPLNYVAADFDASGSVNLTDVLQMLKYYLNKPTTNNVKPEWAFVNAKELAGTGTTATALAIDGQVLSAANAMPHAVTHDLGVDGDTVQIVGVLRGDVDGSWSSVT